MNNDNITQAAAKKAAEEGEPTDAQLAQEVLLEDLEAIANYWDGTMVETAMHGQLDVGQALRERFAKLKFPAIAADRASRQVANKAEVEPVTHLRWWARQIDEGHGNIGHEEGYEVCKPDELSDDGSAAFPVYATPPATTGVSTDMSDEEMISLMYPPRAALKAEEWDPVTKRPKVKTVGESTAARPSDDDLWDATLRDRDTYQEWADKLADAIAKHFDVDIGEHSNQNLPWDEALQAIENAEPVGASTVLTDERVDLYQKVMEICAEQGQFYVDAGRHELASVVSALMSRFEYSLKFAAQAGQVAVPDFRNVTEVKRISDQSLTITFASCASCSKFERAAAPSPAKESK